MPQSLAVVGIAVSALSMGAQAYTSYQQGMAQQQAAQQQARMAMLQGNMENETAQFNAQVATMQAEESEAEGREAKREAYDAAQKTRRLASEMVGEQRLVAASSGAQADQGAFMDLQLDTVEKGELDALAINERGLWADYDKRVQAADQRAQAVGQAGAGALALGNASLQARQARSKAGNTPSWLMPGTTLLKDAHNYWSNF